MAHQNAEGAGAIHTIRAMADAWLGHTTYRAARASGAMEIIGPVALTRNIANWLSDSIFTNLPNADEILTAR